MHTLCTNFGNLNILQQYNWNNFAWFFLFSQWKQKRGREDTYYDIEIPRPKIHDIEIPRPKNRDIENPRPKNHDIEIPRHFFRKQKATTSRFQDWKTTTSSSCGIVTLMPPDICLWFKCEYLGSWKMLSIYCQRICV